MQCSLAYSPCPNDTYIFYALAHRKIDTFPFEFTIHHQDIATLNQLALQGGVDILKISCVTYARVQKLYTVLSSGAALGIGHGPLVLRAAHAAKEPEQWKSIALPGPYTTAHFLLKLWFPEHPLPVFLPFHEIVAQLQTGTLEAGVIIHESRFTYEQFGLLRHLDLGQWWWQKRQIPLPLGCICARASFSSAMRQQFSALIRKSLGYAQAHPEEVMAYIKEHAQESDEKALKDHIALYVNEYTWDLAEKGGDALRQMLNEVEKWGWNQS
ncbi:1,4-dihydroxy-6-naphthoate synthase [Deltaproteobacteria bacterium TL4]